MSLLSRIAGTSALLAASALFTFSCSQGGSSSQTGSLAGAGGEFYVVDTVPKSNGTIYLNQAIAFEFTSNVDLSSVNLNTIAFTSRDPSTGAPLGEPVVGQFVISSSSQRILEFQPTLPTNSTFDNGGFKPGRQYDVELLGSQSSLTSSVRSVEGSLLRGGQAFSFFTPQGSTPQQLFLDSVSGGPTKVNLLLGFEDSKKNPGQKPAVFLNNKHDVDMNFFIDMLPPITLVFNQPVNPSPVNLSANRVYLQYLDPDPNYGAMAPKMTKIPTEIELDKASLSAVSLWPQGVLPTNAQIYIIVEPSFEDISGEANVSDPAYNPVFGTFFTKEAKPFQYDAIVDNFNDDSLINWDSPFEEPAGELVDGAIRASFNFGGTQTLSDFEPTAKVTILNTDFCQVVPKAGVPFTVSGGVFHFHDIVIPGGLTVRGEGSNPLVMLASGEVEIEGIISVDGGNGTVVTSLKGANLPVAGGVGVCGGGNGGIGSPNTMDSSATGATGFGPDATEKGGASGGHATFGPSQANKGAGGGGGSFSSLGLVGGDGVGNSCVLGAGVDPAGGQPGELAFTDLHNDNNFWGRLVNAGVVTNGELKAPMGGQGGGGGGDRIIGTAFPSGPTGFYDNEKGGGGGAGAGVLIIKSIGDITIKSTGRLSADGGDGGGGELNGNCNSGGGGGAGSGGMVVLMSASKIEAIGAASISAKGGIATSGMVVATNKGGNGGDGLVQLHAPTINVNNFMVSPNPVRFPAAFGFLSRLQSKWLYTGATPRQTGSPKHPRFLDNNGSGKSGPEYRFCGTVITGNAAQLGYIDYETQVTGGQATGNIRAPELTNGTVDSVLASTADVSSFHRIVDTKASFGADNSLRGAKLVISGFGEWLIVGNDNTTLYLSTDFGEESAFPANTSLLVGRSYSIITKCFEVYTENKKGLPLLVNNNIAEPTVNVRIRFAACSGFDAQNQPQDRYPASGYVSDLESLTGREAMWKSGGKARPYFMFDVLFNVSYNPDDPSKPKASGGINPEAPKPELRSLVVPYRF